MGTQLGCGMSLLSLKTEWHKSLQIFRCLDYLELNAFTWGQGISGLITRYINQIQYVDILIQFRWKTSLKNKSCHLAIETRPLRSFSYLYRLSAISILGVTWWDYEGSGFNIQVEFQDCIVFKTHQSFDYWVEDSAQCPYYILYMCIEQCVLLLVLDLQLVYSNRRYCFSCLSANPLSYNRRELAPLCTSLQGCHAWTPTAIVHSLLHLPFSTSPISPTGENLCKTLSLNLSGRNYIWTLKFT